MIENHDIIELKTNHIPKGLILLERVFYNNDVFFNRSTMSLEENTIRHNIGTNCEPK